MSRTKTFALSDHRRSKAGEVLNRDGDVLRWRGGGHENVLIEPWGTDSLRIRGTVRGDIVHDLPGALLPAEHTAATTSEDAGTARITNGAITAELTDQGRVTFTRTADGSPLLTEPVPHFSAPV